MKNILLSITRRNTAKRDALMSDEQKYRALITKAATSGGDLSAAEADELAVLAERLKIDSETMEAKVSDAITARVRFEELVKALRTMPAAIKRRAAAVAVRDKAEAHLADVTAKAKAELEAAQKAADAALHEQTRIGNMSAELVELYKGACAEFLPEQTDEITFMQSVDYSCGDPRDPEKDYTRPMWQATKSTRVPQVYQTFNREGQLMHEERR